MEYTKLGNTGMDVSRICLGCMGFGDVERWIHKWVLNEEKSRPIIRKSLELGINFFDTAEGYGPFVNDVRSQELLRTSVFIFSLVVTLASVTTFSGTFSPLDTASAVLMPS